ncbi:MAG: Spy/CpxP family protein refolding chaperone [Acidobacteria bacterium]|nr:Spy/CpxP family protein refolding chaperone [Acidobacteriota bacterium]MCA1608955.1 Spy/CpxP family protein refolding chaperone [Acidobacteriota bacterium]
MMSIKKKLSSGIFAAVATVAFAGFASAQDPAPAPQDNVLREKREGRREGRRGGFGRGMKGGMGRHGGFGMLRGIELTDAQKGQVRTIMENNKPNQAAMEELRSFRDAKRNGTLTDDQKARMKELRQQSRAKREAVHQQLLAVLTPEQRQQIETRKAEMQKRREEYRQKRKSGALTAPSTVN